MNQLVTEHDLPLDDRLRDAVDRIGKFGWPRATGALHAHLELVGGQFETYAQAVKALEAFATRLEQGS